jgi:DNA polymerase-3 subunit gamma/tau
MEAIWPAFLNVLKSKKMSAASYLLEGSLRSCEGGVLTISFPKNYSLHKEALERSENRAIVEKTLEGVLGRRIRIAFIVDSAAKEDPESERKARPAEDYPRQDALKEPIIQSALEAFDGRIVRRNDR